MATSDGLWANEIESSLQGHISEGFELSFFIIWTNSESELVSWLDVSNHEFEHLQLHALLMILVENIHRFINQFT